MTTKNTTKVRVILSNEIKELEGTPEELVEEILAMELPSNVIQFPKRGIFAHPSSQKADKK